MTRRKGEETAAQNERQYPYIVELPVPPNGLGSKLDSMYQFHRDSGIQPIRGRGQRRDSADYVRWCFADRDCAEAFSKAFNGTLCAQAT